MPTAEAQSAPQAAKPAPIKFNPFWSRMERVEDAVRLNIGLPPKLRCPTMRTLGQMADQLLDAAGFPIDPELHDVR